MMTTIEALQANLELLTTQAEGVMLEFKDK